MNFIKTSNEWSLIYESLILKSITKMNKKGKLLKYKFKKKLTKSLERFLKKCTKMPNKEIAF